MKLARLLSTLLGLAALTAMGAEAAGPIRSRIPFDGTVKAGEKFECLFGGRFVFRLVPGTDEDGWSIEVIESGRTDNLAALTPPLHFTTPTDIQGWHFRNEDNTGPNDGSVNQPQEDRAFTFSPEVVRMQKLPTSGLTESDFQRIAQFGSGVLHIDWLILSPPNKGERARILEMSFHCTVSFPAQPAKF